MPALRILRHNASGRFFLLEPTTGRAFGPCDGLEVLRRLRCAQLGPALPYHYGMWVEAFPTRALPGQPQDYAAFETTWLEPSVTEYRFLEGGQATEVPMSTDPLASTKKTPVVPIAWSASSALHDTASLLALARRRLASPAMAPSFGRLSATWWAHPRGSIVIAWGASPGATFVVLDHPTARDEDG